MLYLTYLVISSTAIAPCSETKAKIEKLTKSKYIGVNLTIPLKEEALKYLNQKDSIVNIVADIILMIIGFLFASKCKRSAFIFVIVSEIILYMKIQDNLTKSVKDILIIPLLMNK